MVVITLSIAHTGDSGDMPPKVGCCFCDKVPVRKRKSHPFPCPILNWQSMKEIKKVIFYWISSLLWLTVQLHEFWPSTSKGIWMCGQEEDRVAGPVFGHQPRLGQSYAGTETSVLGAYVWMCGRFSLHLRIR